MCGCSYSVSVQYSNLPREIETALHPLCHIYFPTWMFRLGSGYTEIH